jgi:hypothetical protein
LSSFPFYILSLPVLINITSQILLLKSLLRQ